MRVGCTSCAAYLIIFTCGRVISRRFRSYISACTLRAINIIFYCWLTRRISASEIIVITCVIIKPESIRNRRSVCGRIVICFINSNSETISITIIATIISLYDVIVASIMFTYSCHNNSLLLRRIKNI